MKDSNNKKSAINCKWLITFAVAAITLTGAYLRLANLGLAAMRTDELNGYLICLRGLGAMEIYANIGKLAGAGVMPFTIAFAKMVVDVLGMDVSFYSYRLAFAVTGIAAIPLAYMCGRELRGPLTGLVTALLVAVNPYHIQCSMEGYRYVYTVTGSFMALWVALRLERCVRGERCFGVLMFALNTVAFYLLLNTTGTSWPFAAVSAAVMFVQCIRCVPARRNYLPLTLWALGVLLAALPAMFTSWGFPILFTDTIKEGQEAIRGSVGFWDPEGFKFVTAFAWGDTGPRLLFTFVIALLALYAVWRNRRDKRLIIVAAFLLGGVVMALFGRAFVSAPFRPRYIVMVQAPYIVLLAGGILESPCLLVSPGSPMRKCAYAISGILLGLAVALSIYPAFLAMNLRGTPTPYMEIAGWADDNLPVGTPILCDRYFTANYEFRANSPTSVVFMSTVPNFPIRAYEANKWRETAKRFLLNNPDAAFYEQKMGWDKLGSWTWPHGYFARKQEFLDEGFFKLRELGLNYRRISDQDSEEKHTRTIYYNNRDDLVARAKANGKDMLIIFGDEWQYTKTQDYRDWRGLAASASLDAYNLTGETIGCVIVITGIAVGGDKTVVSESGVRMDLESQKYGRWSLGPFNIESGHTELELRDPNWRRAQSLLLVERVEIVPEDGAGGPE